MKKHTEEELEQIENSLIERVDSVLRYMSKDNKIDLLEMLIDSLEFMREELLF